jgi:hypothetical protein
MQKNLNKYRLPSIFTKNKVNSFLNTSNILSKNVEPLTLIENTEPLTIAYFTTRNDPKIEWFFRSLNRELNGNWKNIFIIIIDYHYQYKTDGRLNQFKQHYEKYTNNVKHISPKPSHLQGKYKVTKYDYFAASNARNTAFINCETSYLVCIDDLTVINNGWLDVVRWGQKNNYIICGSYSKVKNLNCEDDGSYSFNPEPFPQGVDSRLNHSLIKNDFASLVEGSWLFGCSFALPIHLAFIVDGFDEACDGQGAEDYDFGIRLGRITKDIYYSRQMFTYEDEDLHFTPGNSKFKVVSMPLTENTILKDRIGVMSDHAILNRLINSNSHLPLQPQNLSKIKEIYLEDELKLTEHFNELTDWRDGELWSNK